MKIDDLKNFIDFMNKNNLCELEIEEENKRIRLKKFGSDNAVIMPAVPPPIAIKTLSDSDISAPVKTEPKSVSLEIKSPMVGTFYRAASPGAKAYVENGQTINHGDVVCIIEAMKLMNEIKTEVSGKIKQICVENGQPVEFGQVLFIVESV